LDAHERVDLEWQNQREDLHKSQSESREPNQARTFPQTNINQGLRCYFLEARRVNPSVELGTRSEDMDSWQALIIELEREAEAIFATSCEVAVVMPDRDSGLVVTLFSRTKSSASRGFQIETPSDGTDWTSTASSGYQEIRHHWRAVSYGDVAGESASHALLARKKGPGSAEFGRSGTPLSAR
jgi:hypothetical protein